MLLLSNNGFTINISMQCEKTTCRSDKIYKNNKLTLPRYHQHPCFLWRTKKRFKNLIKNAKTCDCHVLIFTCNSKQWLNAMNWSQISIVHKIVSKSVIHRTWFKYNCYMYILHVHVKWYSAKAYCLQITNTN